MTWDELPLPEKIRQAFTTEQRYQIWLELAAWIERHSGTYFDNDDEFLESFEARDKRLRRQLLDWIYNTTRFRDEHRRSENSEGAEYYRGATEAYERVLRFVGRK